MKFCGTNIFLKYNNSILILDYLSYFYYIYLKKIKELKAVKRKLKILDIKFIKIILIKEFWYINKSKINFKL